MSKRYRKSVCVVVVGLFLVAAARDIDDQIRYTAYIPCHHDVQMEMGFNLYSWGKGRYDFKMGKAVIPSPDYEREVLRRLESEGAEVIVNYGVSRRTEGIGLSVGPAVFGHEPGESYWAQKTNDATLESLRGLMRDVAVPLGPLFRNMPERAPEVAILASHAAVILSGSAPWDWTTGTRRFGALMTLVNLDQYVLFDEEIERDGIPPSVKAILMPECEVLTKKTAEKLRAFQARGIRCVRRGLQIVDEGA